MKNGVPVLVVKLSRLDEEHLGSLFIIYECATALLGYLLGINPFDQPGVEEGKRLTHGILGRKGYEEKAQEAMDIAKRCTSSSLRML